MVYRSEEEELRQARQGMIEANALDASRRQSLTSEIGSLLLETRGLELPGVSVYVETLEPATFMEKKFSKNTIHRQGGINGKIIYDWKIAEVVPALELRSAYDFTAPVFIGDSRHQSGTELRRANAVIASDGRIWHPTPSDKRSENVYRCLASHTSRYAELETISLQGLLGKLKTVLAK